MSQSPSQDAVASAPSGARIGSEYRNGWDAVNLLIRQGGSLSSRETNNFYINCGDGTFADASGITGLDFPEDGRAFAVGDLDQDGDLDLILKNRNSPQLRLLRNQAGSGYNAVSFDLKGTRSNRDAVGARITIETDAGSRSKFVKIGSGFLSQSSRRVWFGLGNQEGIRRVKIDWPSGEVQTFHDLAANHRIVIVEGVDRTETIPFRSSRREDERPGDAREAPSGDPPRYSGTWLLEKLAAPKFRLPSVNGRQHGLGMYRGRRVLLNFWATWCPPCREELRDLRSHQEDLADLGAVILAISVDDPADRAKVREYARQEKLPFPVLLADEDVITAYNLVNRFLFDKIRDLAVPTSMLLDRDGNIVKIYRGRVPARQIIRDIQSIPRSEEELVRAAFPFPGQTFGMEFVRDYTVIADGFRRAGLEDQAAVYYQHQLLEQGHDTPQSWNSLGLLYEQEGKLDQAREAYEKALRLNPDYADSHNNLGAMHLKAGEIGKAIDSYRTAARLAPWSADVQNNLGHALVEKGRHAEAVRAYQRAHEIDSQAPQPLLNLGNAYLQMKRFPEAISAYGRVLQMQPDSADVHHNLGFAYLESGRLDDALASFEKALALQPQYASAHNNKGTVFLRTGRFEEAGRAFEGAIQADSEFRPAYINLSMTHLRTNEIEKAEDVLRRLLKVNPDDPMALDLLAQIEQAKSSAP